MKTAAREPEGAQRRPVTRTPVRRDVEPVNPAQARQTMSARTVLRLQASAGNGAVARLVVQRTPAPKVQRLADGGGSCPAPPVAPVAADPKADPKFAEVEHKAKGTAKDLKKHPSGKAEANKARDAAQAPGDDKSSQAKAAQADEMAAAKPKGFDKAAFIAAVKQAIAKAAPKNLDEADKFATSGKADAVKGEVMGKVTEGKEGSAKDVAEKTNKAPDTSVAKDKPVTPMKEQPAPPPPAVDAAKAMPGKAPPEQTDLRAGPCEVKATMADAEVTEQHLTASNEPQMQQAAVAKQEADAHAAQAPGQIRQQEAQTLQQAQAGATADARTAVAAMAGSRRQAGGQVGGRQNAAKAKEEAERARISGEINKIFDKTKGEVEGIVNGLDAKVTAEFDKGEGEARREFTAKHQADMERYKDERYSGATGWARWTADLFTGLPKEADQIFDRAKALYEQKMATVISSVADLIGRELDGAKTKIDEGRQKIKEYVATQPKNLQRFANEAASEMSGRFDQLESDVDAKQESLVDDLAQKYVEARNAVDDEIKAEQEKNKGFVDKAKDMVGDAVQAIIKLKDLFMGLLARAAAAFTRILANPLSFISNFMGAVKQGFMNFAGNILEHLKKGLQGWLFGQLASAGIELPDKFDLQGIIKLIASMLGLTWGSIKARIMAKAPWIAQAIDFIESKVEVFVLLATQGVAGIWNWIKDKVGDLKEMVFGQIKTFVVEKIVKAGITWVLGMLNPAGALIKIVQALISVVQWIMERGAQLGEFIGTIIDAVMDVARGGGGGVPAKIEGSLAKAVPLVISFLAGLLGLGGISEKIKSILQAVQRPVGKAIDAVISGALKAAKGLIAKGKGLWGKAKEKGKALLGKAKAKLLGGDDSPEGKQQRLNKAVATAVRIASRFAGKTVSARVLRPLLAVVRIRYGLTKLEPVARGGRWFVAGAVNPNLEEETPAKTSAQYNVADLKRRAAEAAQGFKQMRPSRGDLAAEANRLGDSFKALEGMGTLSSVEIEDLVGPEIEQLAQLERQLPSRSDELPEGAHTRLAQAGGLRATEGATVIDPQTGQSGKPAHPLKKHGPEASTDYVKKKAKASANGLAAKFGDRAKMETASAVSIDAHQSRIASWLASNPTPGTNLPFRHNPGMGNLAGEAYRYDPGSDTVQAVDTALHSFNEVQVVLKATGSSTGLTYIIQSVYPVLPGT